MNYGLEDLLLSNTLKYLELNVIYLDNDGLLGKYDDRADEGIFLGYASNSKGTLVIIRACINWLTVLTLKLMKESL